MPAHVFKYLIASVALVSLAACAPNKAKPTDPVTPAEPRDCDKPSRDDQGRPVDLC
jgi:hypothetical protein